MNTGTVTLLTGDEQTVIVPFAVARMSGTIMSVLEAVDDDEAEAVVPLPNVTAATLARVLAMCEAASQFENERDMSRHFYADACDLLAVYDDIRAIEYLDIRRDASDADKASRDKDDDDDIIAGAAYEAVARCIRGRSPEQIRKRFNLPEATLKRKADDMIEIGEDDAGAQQLQTTVV